MEEVLYRDLGVMRYAPCLDLQRELFDLLLGAKSTGRRADQWFLTVEHPAVYTLGKSGHENNMLLGPERLGETGAEFYHTDRGGDITFHGRGQIVGYPILDLEREGVGLREYINAVEQTVIDTVGEWGIRAGRVEGASGVWIVETDAAEPNGAKQTVRDLNFRPSAPNKMRKICAIGVRASRYITMHGFALNVNTDLTWFDYINPCGFTDRGVTSMAAEVGHTVDLEEVKKRLAANFEKNLYVKIKY